MQTQITTAAPIVVIDAGRPVASSALIAERFSKTHRDVLRAVRDLVSEAPACARNFALTSIERKMPNGGVRKTPAYTMDRDGFTLLTMGFTGKAALEWKIKYIQAFNEMEAQLRQAAVPMTDGDVVAAIHRRLNDIEERVQLGSAYNRRRMRAADAQPVLPAPADTSASLALTKSVEALGMRLAMLERGRPYAPIEPSVASPLLKLIRAHEAAYQRFLVCIDRMKFDRAYHEADTAEERAAIDVLSYVCQSRQELRDKAQYLRTAPSLKGELQPHHVEALLKAMVS